MSSAEFVPALLTVVRVLAPLFALIVLGAFLRRRGILPAAAVPTLNAIVVNVTLPAMVVLALARAPSLPAVYGTATAAMIGAEALVMVLAATLGIALRLPRPARGMLMMTSTFGNTGFLGYPVALARPLVAAIFPLVVLEDQFAMTIPMYTSATIVGGIFGGPSPDHPGTARDASARGRAKNVLALFGRPIFLSVVVGLAARLIPWPPALLAQPGVAAIGGIAAQGLTYLGQATTPIVLLALGAALRPATIRRAPLLVALAGTLKLIALPLLAWGIVRLLGVHDPAQVTATVQETAMPTSIMCSVLCTQNAMEGDVAVGIVFTTTALAAVTVPLMLSLLR